MRFPPTSFPCTRRSCKNENEGQENWPKGLISRRVTPRGRVGGSRKNCTLQDRALDGNMLKHVAVRINNKSTNGQWCFAATFLAWRYTRDVISRRESQLCIVSRHNDDSNVRTMMTVRTNFTIRALLLNRHPGHNVHFETVVSQRYES